MATLSAAKLNAQYEERRIPIHLIDEPRTPERQTMEADDLGALALNIKAIGLIKPLVVIPRGERYETVAGHRRLLAMRIVKYTPVPCRVVVRGQVDELSILVAENAYTEAVNPVEEARFYERLLEERCGNDVDALAIAVGRRREFVEDRLLILRGYPAVINALSKKRISIAVARELNKVEDPDRLLLLLDTAINQGATARQVVQWRHESALMGPVFGPSDGAGFVPDTSAEQVKPFQAECMFCGGTDEPHLMEYAYIHRPCRKLQNKLLERSVQQQHEES
jgi:ParB family transcriptional regulator, chromosome partitioning protein